jgi:hypothetical protein
VHHIHEYISSITLWVAAFYRYSLIASVYIGMFCNQHHLNYSDNKLWAEMFRTSFINLLCYLHLLSISFVMNVADIYHPHVVMSILWELDHLSLFSLVKLIYIQSLHTLVTLIWPCSRHQSQSSLVWLLLSTFDVWIASLPLGVFRPNLGTRFFLGGRAVTVRVFVMLGMYFVSVKYVFVCIKLMCVYVKLLKI